MCWLFIVVRGLQFICLACSLFNGNVWELLNTKLADILLKLYRLESLHIRK